MKKLLLALPFMLLFNCTEQDRVRSFGGKMEIELPKGQKLMSATWKDIDLFYLTEPMDSGYEPKVKTFKESSSFGNFESEVLFKETK